MRASLLILVFAVLSACGFNDSAPPRALAENELAIRNLLFSWESGNTAALAELFWPDAVYDDFPNQHQYRGVEEIAGYMTYIHTWATGVSMNVAEVHASETGAVAEWVLSAIQDAPIGDLVPVATGREVVLNGVTIIQTDGGRIRRAADYSDALPFVLQLGAEVLMPGGDTIRLDLLPAG
jgi:steroid delta-isomerase-like uncharacterized protein